MHSRLPYITILLCALMLIMGTSTAQEQQSSYMLEMVPMRDDTKLATYIYLPEGEGPFPTLVVRTIYGAPIGAIGGYPAIEGLDDDNEDMSQEEAAAFGWPLITDNGYALVVQVTRGRFNSEGVDRSWLDDANDGYDLIEWVNEQSWSDGRIGIYGDSALGVTALLAASVQPPSLDAVYVQATSGDPMGVDFIPEDSGLKLESLMVQGTSIAFDTNEYHWAAQGLTGGEIGPIFEETGAYLGGLFEGLSDPVNSDEWMALPIAQNDSMSRLMPFWDGVFTPEGQAIYRPKLNTVGTIDIPVYVVTLWQDVFIDSSMDLFIDLQNREIPSRLMVLNGTHYEIDDPNTWNRSVMLDWFDYWLKDINNGIMDTPIVEYDIQGTDQIVTANEWPITSVTDTTFYLASDGNLVEDVASLASVGERTFVYDPANPVPTLGGHHLLAPAGTLDQQEFLLREDVLVYTSDVLTEDTLVAGTVSATVWVTSDAVDTDFSIRLLEGHPDGVSTVILDDLIRLRYRNGRDNVQLIEPGELIELTFDLGHTAHLFEAGNQIQISVTSSDFPAWDRNLNTGISSLVSDDYVTATNTVFSNSIQTSSIILPIAHD